MSRLRTLGKKLKPFAVLIVRFYILVIGAWGVFGLLTGQYLMAAAGLLVPALYFGRFVWRGYQNDTAADADVAS